MNITIPDCPVDTNGQATHQHVASHHQGNGEVTLCGVYIDYRNWQGAAPNAPECTTCRRLDA